MAYAATPDLGDGRLTRASQALPRDSRREAEFRRARAHSKTVLALKGLLPLGAALILSLYALPSFLQTSVDNGRGTLSARGVAVSAGTFVIADPHVAGVNDRGEPYDITASTAEQALSSPEVMYLKVVRGKMTGADGKVTTLSAPDATHNSKTEVITFGNGVTVTHDGGMSATFQTAKAFMKAQTMISKTPVAVRLHESTINAEGMTLYWSESRAIFEGNVRTHIEREPATASAGQSAAGEAAASARAVGSFSGLRGADSNKPIDVEAGRLEVDDKKHTAVFIGNVLVTQGDNNLKAPRLEVFYEAASGTQGMDKGWNPSNVAKPARNASAGVSAGPISGGQIKRLRATGGKVLVISAKDKQEATGDDALYDVAAQKVTMTGKKVVLRQSSNMLEGTKLEINLDTGKWSLVPDELVSASATPGKARIRAVFQPETGPDGKPMNSVSKPKTNPLSGADSKKPINIESARLEADDKNHTAVFMGNVSVTQGDNNLKAPRLEVFYENASKTSKPVKSASASTSDDPLSSGQIKLIHATGGKVIVTSTRDKQEATGDDAVYDVESQKVTMTGKKVVLRQSTSVLEGTKLEIDLKTGKANLVRNNRSAGGAKRGRTRIRALFQQQRGADGRLINPLNDPKASRSGKPKKSGRSRSKPPRKAAHPKRDATRPAGDQDWQTQSR